MEQRISEVLCYVMFLKEFNIHVRNALKFHVTKDGNRHQPHGYTILNVLIQNKSTGLMFGLNFFNSL